MQPTSSEVTQALNTYHAKERIRFASDLAALIKVNYN